ncbi:hypothetical protein OIU78_021298 [Salix suchowensis]|nr:hypothetical protein OIU78_021298 [Salix suchowensis]
MWFNKYDAIFGGKKRIGGMHLFLPLTAALGSNRAIVLLSIFSLLGICFQVGHCSLSKELYFFYVAGKENFHQMHIMICWDMPYLPNKLRQYHLLVIHARTLLILDQFTLHLLTPVSVFQMVLVLTITGMAHQYLVRSLVPMLFLPWISIITVGSTILLPFRQQAIE